MEKFTLHDINSKVSVGFKSEHNENSNNFSRKLDSIELTCNSGEVVWGKKKCINFLHQNFLPQKTNSSNLFCIRQFCIKIWHIGYQPVCH